MPTSSPAKPTLLERWAERLGNEPTGSLALSLLNVYETFAISFPTVVDAALGRVTKAKCDERLRSWAENVVAHLRIELDVTGSEHVERGRAYLVMSNHQSHYDIPVLFVVAGPNIRMIAKKELFKIPIFGPAIHEAGFISIDRSNRSRAMVSLDQAREAVEGGVHVWIAPEGTRSKTGELLPFKKGGFNLAMDAKIPILPITIDGTKDILPPNAVRSRAGARVRVVIHPPIEPAPPSGNGLNRKQTRDQLMSDVRRALERGF